MTKSKKIEVEGKEITILYEHEKEFISLTDMLKAKDGDFLYQIGFATEIQLSIWEFGNRFIIPILIMANSP